MDAPYFNGDQDFRSRFDRRPEEREQELPAESCDYCGNPLGPESVTVAGKGKWCSRDCRNADAAHVYMVKQRKARREIA